MRLARDDELHGPLGVREDSQRARRVVQGHHSSAFDAHAMSRSSVGDVCRHRSSPHCLADSSSAVVDSHDGVWMPFVTWPIGTSAVGQRGKTDLKMCRLTSPWRRRTPFAAALPRMATYAM